LRFFWAGTSSALLAVFVAACSWGWDTLAAPKAVVPPPAHPAGQGRGWSEWRTVHGDPEGRGGGIDISYKFNSYGLGSYLWEWKFRNRYPSPKSLGFCSKSPAYDKPQFAFMDANSTGGYATCDEKKCGKLEPPRVEIVKVGVRYSECRGVETPGKDTNRGGGRIQVPTEVEFPGKSNKNGNASGKPGQGRKP